MDQKGKIDHQMLTMHVSQSCVAPAAVKKGRLARFVAVVPSQHVVRGLCVFDANYVFLAYSSFCTYVYCLTAIGDENDPKMQLLNSLSVPLLVDLRSQSLSFFFSVVNSLACQLLYF